MRSTAPLVVLLALAAPAAGCSRSGGSTLPAAAAGGSTGAGAVGGAGTQAALPPQGTWLKGDFHQHTAWSHDAVQFGDDARVSLLLAERAGLDFTSLTDHRTFDNVNDPMRAHPRVIGFAGMEWNGDGHAGVVGIKQPNSFPVSNGGAPDRNAVVQQVIDEIHRQGGIFIVNHPTAKGDLWIWTATGYDAVEVWNQNWAFRSLEEATPAFVARGAADNGVTAPWLEDACRATGVGVNGQAVKFWEEFLDRGLKVAAVGGGDRHYLALPGNPTTRVFAAAATEQDILAGVKKGRTMVTRGPDAPEVDFAADGDGDGILETIVGGSLPLGEPVTFSIRIQDCQGGKAALIRDGQPIQTWSVGGVDFSVTYTETTPSARSWYRLDVWEPLDMSVPGASTLKALVLGTANQSWIQNLGGISILGWLTGFAGRVQEIIETGGPAALWLLIYGDRMGVRISHVPTHYPAMEFPEGVSRLLNVDPADDGFCRAVITSPIWAE